MPNDGDNLPRPHPFYHSSLEVSGSLNKRSGRKSASFRLEKENAHGSSSNISINDIVEDIALDVEDDSVAVHSIKTAGGGDIEDPDSPLLGRSRRLEKKTSTLGTTSMRDIGKGPQEMKRWTSSSRRHQDHTESAAGDALEGLNFISNTAMTWDKVQSRFHELTEYTEEDLLRRAHFGMCIGMIEIPKYMIPKSEDKKSKDKKLKELRNEYTDEKLEELWKEFKDYVPEDKSQGFAVQLFDALSRHGGFSGEFVNESVLKIFWDQISDKSFGTRVRIFFDMVDKDADGKITKEEVREILALSASTNILSNFKNHADEYAELIMEVLDSDNSGTIEIQELQMLLLEDPTHRDRGVVSKEVHQLPSEKLKVSDSSKWFENFKYFLPNNWQRVWVMVLWLGVMAGLFAYKYIQYKNSDAFDVMGHCVCMAKGSAETLKLNMALILLPVCRHTITWLRNKTRLEASVPFGDSLNFHHIIAIAIAIGVGIHGISHLACDFPRLLHATAEEYEPMVKYFGDQPKSYWWFVKGFEGVTGIIMVVLMAIAFTLATTRFRRNKVQLLPKPFDKVTTGYNAFWYSHHLFVIVYTLLIVHGIKLYLTKEWYKKTTWMYLAVPIILYASERLLKSFRSRIKSVVIHKAVLYPTSVLALYMEKPKGFEYKSGQYIFVKCPKLSPFEWHPFSITSAPGDKHLSVHIKKLGDWTKKLQEVFKDCQHPPGENSGLQVQDNPNYPKVLINGPYGAPAQDYKNYDIVLLVGLGIGVTPMISIVKDIVNNMKANDEMSRLRKDGNFRTTKAYFYWVTGQQGTFEWFDSLINEVAAMDHKEVVETHIHCTSVYEEGDARSALITMLQKQYHEKTGVDVVSGTRVKSHFARPDWEKVYKHIHSNHPNTRIGVFYCGNSSLTKKLEEHAFNFSHKTSTKFDFHKEIF